MNRVYILGFCCLLAWGSLSGQEILEIDLLTQVEPGLRDQQEGQQFYQLDQARLKQLYDSGLTDHLVFSLPLKEDTLKVGLQRVALFHPDFFAKNARNEVLDLPRGYHYQAFHKDTLYALSFFPDQLVAQVQTKGTQLTLGAISGKPGLYSLTQETGEDADSYTCHTSDEINSDLQRQMDRLDQSVKLRSALPALDIYFELDHFIYQEQNQSLEQCMAYMASIFNSVAQLYRLEGIGVRIKSIKIWDEPDPYPTRSANRALASFRSLISEEVPFPDWDIGLLLSRYTNEDGLAPHGGLAYVDGMCTEILRYGYANLGSQYEEFPVYSFTVFVIAHEIGHTIASPHTHNCSWPNGPLDDCYCPEGNCQPGPSATVEGGGTIMSYCYVMKPFDTFRCPEFPSEGNPGVNFLNAFGKQPGDLMRLRIRDKSCLQDRPAEELPNLIIDSIQSIRRVNDTVFVNGLVIKNDGMQAAPSFRIGVFQGATYLGTLSAGSIAGNVSESYDYYFLLPDTNYQKGFYFQADLFQEVVEWHEGDNLYQKTVSESVDFPVFTFQAGTSVIDKDYFFFLPDLSIQNTGWAPAGEIILRYSLATASDSEAPFFPLSQKTISGLDRKAAYDFSLGFFEPALSLPGGSYYLRIDVISENEQSTFFWPGAIHIASAYWEWFKK